MSCLLCNWYPAMSGNTRPREREREKPGILSSSSPSSLFRCLLSWLFFRPVFLDVSTTSFVSLMHAPHRHQHDGPKKKPTATCVCVYLFSCCWLQWVKRVARIVNLFSQLARGACRDGGYVGRDYRKSISFFSLSFLWAATGSTHLALSCSVMLGHYVITVDDTDARLEVK
jgi:hypothetical protein